MLNRCKSLSTGARLRQLIRLRAFHGLGCGEDGCRSSIACLVENQELIESAVGACGAGVGEFEQRAIAFNRIVQNFP